MARGYGDGLYGDCTYGGVDVLQSYREGFVRLPTTAPGTGNYLSVPRVGTVDPSTDWRIDCVRPTNPAVAARPSSIVMFFQFFPTALYSQFYASDTTQPSTAALYSTLEAAGFPLQGERVHIRGTWDTATDTLSLNWRLPNVDLSLATGWNFAASTVFAGKQINAFTTQYISDPFGFPLGNDLYRSMFYTNGVLEIDVHPDTDLPANPAVTTFTATTGQTVTVARGGVDPQTELFPHIDNLCSVAYQPLPCPDQQPAASGPEDRLALVVPCPEGADC